MSDLRDRMLTCAAHLAALNGDKSDDDKLELDVRVTRDAALLLQQGAEQIAAPEPRGESPHVSIKPDTSYPYNSSANSAPVNDARLTELLRRSTSRRIGYEQDDSASYG